MSKIFKNMVQVKGSVIAILLLLIVQAYCDLALPSYTSDIVDIGIQQGGIDHIAPEKVSRETFLRLCLLLEQGEEEAFRSAYTPGADGCYHRNKLAKDELQALDDMLGIPAVLLYSMQDLTVGQMMEQSGYQPEGSEVMPGLIQMPSANPNGEAEGEFTQKITPEDNAGTQNSDNIGEFYDKSIWELADDGMLGKEQILQMKEGAAAQMAKAMGDMSQSIISQKANLFVKEEYEKIGLDLGHLQMMYLLRKGGMMLLYAIVGTIAALCVGFLAARSGAQIGRTLRDQVFKKVVSFSNNEMNHFSTASLITRSTNDIQQVQMVTTMLLRMVLYAPIVGIGGVLKVSRTRTGLDWIIIVAVLLICAFVFSLMIVAMPKFQIMQTLVDRLNLVAREILTGLPVIRAFSREKHEEERFAQANRNLMRTQLFTNRVMTFMMPIMTLIMNGISVAIVWFGAKGVDLGNLQVGDMMAFITYTMMIVMSFLMITMMSIMLPRAGVAAARIDEIIRSESSITDQQKTVPMAKEKAQGIVTFEDVSFRYENADDDALSHISFTALPGQTTAIIGSTGSGKSTMIHLIDRFYDVTDGKITIDGVDIRDMTQHDLHAMIGLVPQKGILFLGTIGSNIRFDGAHVSEEKMKEAAAIAQATEFIESKKEQYDSAIAQGGSNVSGGQKQRLSIARAIAKDPKIYLFDDSFSALDYKTDTMLRKALRKKTEHATVIIVAQRISTIMHAEQIIVLDEGKIAGIGTHEELLASCETYQEIAGSQLSQAELKGGRA